MEGIGWWGEALAMQILTGEFWNLAVYGKGLQHRIFLHNRSFASEGFDVQVLVLFLFFGSVKGSKLWFQVWL